MKQKRISTICLAIVAVGAGLCVLNQTSKLRNPIIISNVEALTTNETLDCNYNRDESTCSVYVGVGGKIKLFGIGIIRAGADGYVSFDGKVVCSSGGNQTCTPIECRDLYETIF